MDLIAVWLDCGEGLHGNILQEESRTTGKRMRPHLSHSSNTEALITQGDIGKGKIRRINNLIFMPKYVF